VVPVNSVDTNNLSMLRAVLDRIIPADDYPSASQAGVDAFILRLWQAGSEPSAGLVGEGLTALQQVSQARFGETFEALGQAVQDALIDEVSNETWFKRLCELAAEGYYADPDNGANPNASSWQMIGYRPGLPEGDAGPAWDRRDAQVGKLWS
jgi:Gluconate 2-dehydrogenase subunit 3